MVDADDMEMTEAFRVLCLPPHATAYEVKRAYRKAALAVLPVRDSLNMAMRYRFCFPSTRASAATAATTTTRMGINFCRCPSMQCGNEGSIRPGGQHRRA